MILSGFLRAYWDYNPCTAKESLILLWFFHVAQIFGSYNHFSLRHRYFENKHRSGSWTWSLGQLLDSWLWQNKPDTATCNLNSPIHDPAVGQNHHHEPDLLNLMVKPINKAHRIRYNFYGILIYSKYLIILWMTGSLESAFLFFNIKNSSFSL